MCSINGFTKNDEAKMREMARVTAHRGPDATTVYAASGITFGHNRLSIIDLSDNALQPMHSHDKRYSLIFNGEIYNYRELRAELCEEFEFKTQSDTEVLLAAYTTWGTDALKKLRGIFAFALYDSATGELLLVRDHMGVKPLYYAVHEGVLYFSSELSGVLAMVPRRTLSRTALSQYVALNYVPSGGTMVEGIQKLPPAHLLRFKEGNFHTERYWTPESLSSGDCVYDMVDKAVQRQLVSDRPIGVLLSGGLDSSIVLHHTARHSKQVATFSTDFEMLQGGEKEYAKFNTDAILAKRTAAVYETNHTTFTISLDDVRAGLHSALGAFDEPIANPTSVARYFLCKWVRESGVVVALGGDGGDELFGGYKRYQIAHAAAYMQTLPTVAQQLLARMHPQLRTLTVPLGAPLHERLLALKPSSYAGLFYNDTTQTTVQDWFNSQYAQSHIEKLKLVDAFMRVDRETWLADESLAETDRMSMAHGLEVRVPLLDTAVVALADGLRYGTKFTPLTSKKIVRETYKDHLPSFLFSGPKRGWISPGAKWFRDPVIKKYVEEVLSSTYYNGLDSVINWDEVQKMFVHHTEGGGYHLYPLWNILQLQIWAEKYKIISE